MNVRLLDVKIFTRLESENKFRVINRKSDFLMHFKRKKSFVLFFFMNLWIFFGMLSDSCESFISGVVKNFIGSSFANLWGF